MNISELRFAHEMTKNTISKKIFVFSRFLVLLGKLFTERRIPVLAQSLAYTTIFTLVPILAVFFAVLGKITKNVEVIKSIKEFISVYLFPEYVNSVFVQLEKLSVNSTIFGAIGLPTLFLASVFLYVKVDSSINEIWLSQKKRQWFKNSLAFFMTLILGPMIMVLVFSLLPVLLTLPYYAEVTRYVFIDTLFTKLIPIIIIFASLFVLYLYIPVASVKYSAAIKGALFAAPIIQISNHVVSIYLKSFSKLDVFYGSLAMIPIFLLWVFVLWTVVLTGAMLTFIFHYNNNTKYIEIRGMYNNESLLCSALQILVFLVQSFQKKDAAPNFEQIQLVLGMNRKRLSYILDILQQENLVLSFIPSSGKRGHAARFQPAISPRKIKLKSLIPLFSNPRDLIIFDENLRVLIKTLEMHPGFLVEDISLDDVLKKPQVILQSVKKNEDLTKTEEIHA